MTYHEFLEFIFTPITSFVNWLGMVANSLMSNYIFMTFLGITIFISLVWVVYDFIKTIIDNISSKYDDYNDRYYNYELFKEVQSDYLDKHYTDEYDYRYRSKVLNSQVLNGYLQLNKDLDIDNKRLANKNKMESLKEIKEEILNDDDSSNDNDIDLIVPPKPQLASVEDLKLAELKEFHQDTIKEINSDIDRILFENGYIDYKGNLVKIDTGEVVLSDTEKNRILQHDFEDYNSLDKFENDFVRESRDTFNEEYRKGEYK